jgi:hypothetical protein
MDVLVLSVLEQRYDGCDCVMWGDAMDVIAS